MDMIIELLGVEETFNELTKWLGEWTCQDFMDDMYQLYDVSAEGDEKLTIDEYAHLFGADSVLPELEKWVGGFDISQFVYDTCNLYDIEV